MKCCRKHELESVIADAALAMALLPRTNGKPDGKIGMIALRIMDRATEDLIKEKTPEELKAIEDQIAAWQSLF